MNILILSAGTRNKIVQYFKKELDGRGKVVATDMSALAPALYEADNFYIVPRMTEEGYIEKILHICQKEKINGVFSLIDPELSLLAQNRTRFEKIGVKVVGSSFDRCELSLNKYDMFHWLSSHNYKCAKSYIKIEDFYIDLEKGLISFPVFVKPVRGSASIAISKVDDKETLELLFKQSDDLMIQEYLQGQEIGADVYIDMIT
ncbi:MAG: ATP-grasp domain-containing protein, partial [Clostridia bacterium]|nr:ATP-grasp domain-containing protein [Clostridia bacterium]